MLQYIKYLTTILFKPETVSYSPVHIQLEPTNYCNLKCKMCIRDNIKSDNKNMTLEEYKVIISRVKPQKVTFAGSGEPTINKELFDMIKYSRENGISTMISTNMTLFDDGKARKLIETGLNTAKISIDAAKADTYYNIRGEEYFDKIISSIENISATKKKTGGRLPELRFDFVILKDNAEEIPEAIKLAKKLGIATIYFRPLQKVGLREDVQKNLTQDFKSLNLEKILKEGLKLSRTLGINTNIKEILSNIKYYNELYELNLPYSGKICLLPWLQSFVAVNGDIAPCCALYFNGGIKLGNVFKDGFENIWNGEEYKKIRRDFKRHKVFKICRDCAPRDIKTLLSMMKFVPKFMRDS